MVTRRQFLIGAVGVGAAAIGLGMFYDNKSKGGYVPPEMRGETGKNDGSNVGAGRKDDSGSFLDDIDIVRKEIRIPYYNAEGEYLGDFHTEVNIGEDGWIYPDGINDYYDRTNVLDVVLEREERMNAYDTDGLYSMLTEEKKKELSYEKLQEVADWAKKMGLKHLKFLLKKLAKKIQE